MKLKKLLVLAVIFNITACATSNFSNVLDKRSNKGNQLRIKNLLSYSSECPNKSTEYSKYCECDNWAKDKSGKAPNPFVDIVENEHETVRALLGYFERLEKCEQFAPIKIDFKIPENTKIANKILSNNKNNLLTPDNFKNMEPIGKPVGWVYKMDSPDKEVDFSYGAFQYRGKDKYGYVFSYTGSNDEYVYISGIRHYRNQKKDHSLRIYDLGNCTYVIGECIYGSKDDRRKVFTKFENGVWIRNVSNFSPVTRRALQKVIYDNNGIPLYIFEQNSKNYIFEKVRHESIIGS